MLIDTPAKMKARQNEFDLEEIGRLKRMNNREMGRIILDAKFGIDSDFIPGLDSGCGPKGSY